PAYWARAADRVAGRAQGGSRGAPPRRGTRGLMADTTTRVRRIPISLPSTGDEEWQAVREPLTSGWLTQGPKVAEFEKAFAERHGVAHALATTSCTTGLHLLLAAAG